MIAPVAIAIFGYLLGLHSQFIILKTSYENHFEWLHLRSLLQIRSRNVFLIRIRRRALLYGLAFLGLWLYNHSLAQMGILTLLILLYTAARTDYQRGVVPDGLSLVGVALGLIFSTFASIDTPFIIFTISDFRLALLMSSLIGMLVTSSILLWIAILFEKITGREGLGFGDVKLAGMLGAFLGVQGGFRVLVYGAWIGLVFDLIRMLIVRNFSAKRSIPFAPALAVGAIVYLWRFLI